MARCSVLLFLVISHHLCKRAHLQVVDRCWLLFPKGVTDCYVLQLNENKTDSSGWSKRLGTPAIDLYSGLV